MIESIFMPAGLEDMILAYSSKLIEEPSIIFDIIRFDRPNMQVGALVAMLIKSFIYAGVYNMMFLIINGYKKNLSFEGFAIGYKIFWQFIVISILVTAINIAGVLLFVIPGIIWGVRIQYAVFVLLNEEDVGIIGAIKRSWQITRGNFWRLLGFEMLAVLLFILGVAFFFIGAYVTMAVVTLTDMLIYIKLTNSEQD